MPPRLPVPSSSTLADFWAEALDYEVEDPSALIQQLLAEPGGLDTLVARLEELGATRVREVDKGPAGRWWIMQDHEGNQFCAA